MAEPLTNVPPPDSVALTEFKGLINTVAPERMEPGELESARNVDIDDRGHLRRRRGWSRVATGAFHSLFAAADETLYGVRDGALVRILPSHQTVTLEPGIGTERLAYVQVGDQIFFSSSVASGVIYADDTVGPWGAPSGPATWLSPVVNPTSTLPDTRGKLIGPPPMATALAHHNGRIYLAQGRVVWATELYLYHYVDKTKNFLPFESDVTLLAAVKDGFYVGTEDAVYYLSGPFREMRRELVLRVGAVPGSAALVGGGVISPPQFREQGLAQSRPAVMFLTRDGVCVGYDGGTVYNLTEDRMVFPDAVNAAAMFRQQDGMNQYIAVTSSGGTPASTARVGDYVDAEIRRFRSTP
jgi:hypothetical protein